MPNNAGEQLDAFVRTEPAPRRTAVAQIQILRLPQVCRVTGLCRSSIYQMEAEGHFPSRVKIGARSVGWIESEAAELATGEDCAGRHSLDSPLGSVARVHRTEPEPAHVGVANTPGTAGAARSSTTPGSPFAGAHAIERDHGEHDNGRSRYYR